MSSYTPEDHLRKIREHVYRLTINTLAPIPGAGRHRRPVTTEPLLTELRNGIRPDQGGTGNGRAAGWRLPFDADAFTLYEDITGQIASMYHTATDLPADGTPEQLLLEWFHEFDHIHRTEGLSTAQLAIHRTRIARWRHRIEDHFAPPRVFEYPLCPKCGYTHVDVVEDGDLVRMKCVRAISWPDRPHRDPIAECRNCGARWVGRHSRVDEHGVTQPGIDELDADIAANVEHYGPIDFALAPVREEPAPLVHLAPPAGSGLTPCCGRTPLELPTSDRITASPSRATCTGRQELAEEKAS